MNPHPRLRALIVASLILVTTAVLAAAPPSWDDHPENIWIKQSPRPGTPAPGFLYEGSGDYDPVSRKWIHHAGHDGIPQGFHTFTCDLATGAWKQHFPPTSPPGVCCVDGSHVFDIANGRFVRFPGGSLGHGYQWSRGVYLKNSAVWLYDPITEAWTNMRPPPYQEPAKYSSDAIGGLCSGGTYAPNHQIAISFGGSGAGGAKNSLFFYDAYANSLQQIKAANPPPARDGMGFACDTSRNQLVMFGSQYLSDEQTWLYHFQSNRWEAHTLEPHPPAKKSETYSTIPKLAYDSLNDRLICIVWLGERGGHETWSLDPGKLRWTKLNPAAEPASSKSRSRNLTYAPDLNLFMLELSSTNNRPELWTYRFKKSPTRLRPPAPSALTLSTEATKATLRWTAPSNSPVSEYQVFRAPPAEPWRAEFKQIATVKQPMFEDSEVTPGSAFFYAVKAVARDGSASELSRHARSQPIVPAAPVVSVRATDRVEIKWQAHPAKDVAGYNLYRGVVSVKTVKKGEPGAWKDNDPEYAEPLVVRVTNLSDLKKLNAGLLRETTYTDPVDLTRKGPEAADYKFAVHAYILRAVNQLGVESGPSPYALTIPSEPVNVLCRENRAEAELKWDANAEAGLTGYRVYGLKGTWQILPLTPQPIAETKFVHKTGSDSTRFWVVAVDAIGQEGQPSSPAWANHSYRGFYSGEWHQ